MEYDEFRRVLARLYKSENAVATALSTLRRAGFIQRRVHLTASGSALLAKTTDQLNHEDQP